MDVFILFNNSFKLLLIPSCVSNSLTNFSLFQIMFPFVSIIASGNGEFIKVVLAVVFTFIVRSLSCSESSAFLLLFDQIEYVKRATFKTNITIISVTFGFNTQSTIDKTAIIIKYILVLETNASDFNILPFGIKFPLISV